MLLCFFAAKRRADSSLDGPPAKVARAKVEQDVTESDLIVLGIPYTFTTADLQAFFSQFGQLKVCQVRVLTAQPSPL